MEISDYIKEMDLLKQYFLTVRIPYLSQYIIQDLRLPHEGFRHAGEPLTYPMIEKYYNNKYYPNLGKVFPVWVSYIPSFEDFKEGKDMTYFGTIIE